LKVDGPIENGVGKIQLYDPSGIIRDSTTNEPIQGATVSLYHVPGWTAVRRRRTTASRTRASRISPRPPAHRGASQLPRARGFSRIRVPE